MQGEQSLVDDPVLVGVNCKVEFQAELMVAGTLQVRLVAEEVDSLQVRVVKKGVGNPQGPVAARVVDILLAGMLEAVGILRGLL